MKIRNVLSTVGLVTMLSFSVLPSVSNAAENVSAIKNVSAESGETTLTEKDFQKIESHLLDMGVDATTAEKLLTKLESGGVIDSDIMTPEEAVSTTEVVEDGLSITNYIFPDGSRSQIKAENIMMARGISGGSCTSGSGYTTCSNREVSYEAVTYGFSFRANYETASGAYDQINSVDKWNIWTAGGTYVNPSLRIIKAKENASGKAEARLSGTITLANSAGSMTRSLSLHVGSDTATSKWNKFY